MRIAVFAVVSLIAGAVFGALVARQEFSGEILPIDAAVRSVASGAAGEDDGPRLTLVSPDRHYFGFMDESAKGIHTFEIRNDGNAPMTLNQEGTSCKCTVAGLSQETLAPGETAKITLEWTVKQSIEPFEQYAEYRTNDLRRPKFRLVIYGQVLAAIRAEPREAIFNRVPAQESARATVKIFAVGDSQLQVLNHTFVHAKSAPYFNVQFTPLDPAAIPADSNYRTGVEMHVDLKPGLPLGQLQQAIQITTSLNPEATLTIPVYGSIVSDISLVGPRTTAETMTVDLGTFKSQEGAKSTIYLVVKGTHREQTELKIAGVQPAAELAAVVGEPIRDNPQIVSYPVTLTVPKGSTPVSRVSSGSKVAVRVETTHPELKELTFYVRYAVVE